MYCFGWSCCRLFRVVSVDWYIWGLLISISPFHMLLNLIALFCLLFCLGLPGSRSSCLVGWVLWWTVVFPENHKLWLLLRVKVVLSGNWFSSEFTCFYKTGSECCRLAEAQNQRNMEKYSDWQNGRRRWNMEHGWSLIVTRRDWRTRRDWGTPTMHWLELQQWLDQLGRLLLCIRRQNYFRIGIGNVSTLEQG